MVVSHRLTFPLLAGRNGMKLSHRLNTLCTCAERDSTGTELWCHTNQSKHSWKKGVYKIQHKWTNRINENNNRKTKNTHTHQQTLKKKKEHSGCTVSRNSSYISDHTICKWLYCGLCKSSVTTTTKYCENNTTQTAKCVRANNIHIGCIYTSKDFQAEPGPSVGQRIYIRPSWDRSKPHMYSAWFRIRAKRGWLFIEHHKMSFSKIFKSRAIYYAAQYKMTSFFFLLFMTTS